MMNHANVATSLEMSVVYRNTCEDESDFGWWHNECPGKQCSRSRAVWRSTYVDVLKYACAHVAGVFQSLVTYVGGAMVGEYYGSVISFSAREEAEGVFHVRQSRDLLITFDPGCPGRLRHGITTILRGPGEHAVVQLILAASGDEYASRMRTAY